MAKYYFRLALLVGAIVGFFAIIGSVLPRSYSFSTEIEITAEPAMVFAKINSLRSWQEWSRQWNPDEIADLEIQYNGEPVGAGAAQSWTDIRGNGKLWITASQLNESIEYEMKFAKFPTMTSQIELSPVTTGEQDKATHVRWSSQGRLPSGPFYGYFGAFFSAQMKSEYEKSLKKLKSILEPESAVDSKANAGPDQEFESGPE